MDVEKEASKLHLKHPVVGFLQDTSTDITIPFLVAIVRVLLPATVVVPTLLALKPQFPKVRIMFSICT